MVFGFPPRSMTYLVLSFGCLGNIRHGVYIRHICVCLHRLEGGRKRKREGKRKGGSMGQGGKEGALLNGIYKHTKHKIFTPIKLEYEYMNDHYIALNFLFFSLGRGSKLGLIIF